MSIARLMQQAAAGVPTAAGGWDISTATYNGESYSFDAQDLTPQGCFVGDSGSKLYIIGQQNDSVYEYDLSSAWDVSSATYVQSFSVSAQENTPTDLFFKSDGSKMYVIGSGGDDVNEYDLSTAWDISSASYSQNFSVSSQDTVPQGVYFRDDGEKMYVVGNANDSVYEYDLSTGWDVSTASYVQSFSVATNETQPRGVFLKPDGLKMFTIGLDSDEVDEYDLSSAWDISTASYSQSFSVTSQASVPTGFFFKPDGTKMYVADNGADDVFAYDL